MTEEELKEREHNVKLALNLLSKNARDFLVVFTSQDGVLGIRSSSRVYGHGAVREAEIYLDQRSMEDEGEAQDP